MGSKKMVSVNLFAEKEWVYRYSKQTYEHSGDESGRNGESSMDTYTLLCVK